jgi:polar amino acid transport system substrate-binding protein
MAHLAWTIGLFLILTGSGQAQSIQYRFWAGEIPPYSYRDRNQQPDGDLLRIFQTLVERMGYKTKVEILPWKRVLMEARKDPPTLFIPLARSPDREKLYQWIEPLLLESFGIFRLRRREPDPQDTEGIPSPRLCILRGSATEELARRHQLGHLVLVSTNDTCARLLKSGRVDGWLAAKRAAFASFALVGYDPKDLSMEVRLEQWPLYLAASKGTPDTEVQRWKSELQKMKSDGTFERLLRKKPARAAGDKPGYPFPE